MGVSTAGDYVGGNVFVVDIGGISLSFAKISGIGGSTEFDTFVEGGGQMHLLPKPKTAASNITFTKGISLVDKDTAAVFAPGAMLNGMMITLLKDNVVVENYFVQSAMVVSWQLGDLDALSSQVAIKSFQIAHTGIIIG